MGRTAGRCPQLDDSDEDADGQEILNEEMQDEFSDQTSIFETTYGGFDSPIQSSDEDPGVKSSLSESEINECAKPGSPKPAVAKKLDPSIPPPAPLFYDREESEGWLLSDESEHGLPKSGTSLILKHPPPELKPISVEDEPFADPVVQPCEPRELSTLARPKNVSSGGYPDGLQGKLVYDCFALNAQRRVNHNSDLNFYKISDETDTTLVFDSLFESGHLYQGLKFPNFV